MRKLRSLVVTGLVSAGLFVAASPAAAVRAGDHPTAGTYEFHVRGEQPWVMVLRYDHLVYPQSFLPVSWHQRQQVISIRNLSLPAPPSLCQQHSVPLDECQSYTVWLGTKTIRGIGTPSRPGIVTDYVGPFPLSTSSFYAVWIGNVRSGVR